MKKIIALVVATYLIVQSWTSAFTFNPLFPPHVVFGITSVLSYGCYKLASKRGVARGAYELEDNLTFFLIAWLTIAALSNPRGIDSVKYIAAYVYVFIFAFLGIKGALYETLETKSIFDYLIVGVMLTSAVSAAEIVIDYRFGVDISTYLFRHREIPATYGGILRHGGIPRSAAFSTEPGILAFYLETLGLIAAWSIWRRQWGWGFKALSLSIIFAGWVASFSAASVAGLLAGISVVAFIALYRTRSLMARSAIIFVLPLMLWGGYEAPRYLGNTYLDPIISKINLEGSSARGRLSRWVKGMNKVSQNPIVGVGPGTASSKGKISNISWYLFLSVESGILSVIIVISFLFTKFVRLVKSNLQGKYVFITSFVAGSVHLAVISTFFHPFLWTTIAITDVMINRTKNKNIHVRHIS